ncbi:type VII secretion protein EsaA [Bacillus haynesii]|nr:type VII secretion protein EsaA [Bacillus haynesii]MCY8047178.1 type VII secretion protein EsaA [Bacillus haynesii]MCY8079438.1 type VII secretion protein EsaA [Bacillus haynesii]MCY8384613.1 type VII secretion protein EsaA [Bacillus haynesii]MCY8587458.1 type VII secretion protein EsaA [Bacillus haynesii]
MTEQQKSTLKIISAIVTIILLPVLFFHFIGENPTKKVSNATREIAVVNEDTGILKDDGTIDQEALLGNEISASLVDRPDYKWTVVNRSAAESGLSEKQYDAIVYIPSDFSQNILSYNHERPQKAELEFKIQDQLDAVNKEKVQRELQDAQKTVSKKMSSLYWRFVKQGVKKVRKEFDSIVNKESEFQNAMYNFYKPSSNNLAGEVERQKEMIDRLKESINETEGTSKERNASVEESKKQLDSFVDNVNQYKQYQEKQSELLQAAQADSEGQIQDGLTVIKEKQSSATSRFNEQMSGMAASFNGLQNQFSLTANSFQNLQTTRENQVPLQFNGIDRIQNELIDDYQAQTRSYNLSQLQPILIDKRSKLTVTSEDPGTTDPGDDQDNDDEDQNDDEEQPKDLKIDLQEQQDELKSIAADLKELSDGLKDSSGDDGNNSGDKEPSAGEPNQDQNQDPSAGEPNQDQNQDPSAGEPNQDQNQDPSAGEPNPDQSQDETGENSQQDGSTSVDETGNQGTGEDGQTENPGDEPEDEIAKLKAQLNEAAARIEKVEADLREKQETHNEELKKQLEKFGDKVTELTNTIQDLNKDVEKLNGRITKLEESQNEDFKTIYSQIETLENEILSYPMGAERKEKLKEAFASEINTRDVRDLLRYHNTLSVYRTTLYGSVDYLIKSNVISAKKDSVDTVLKIGETEAEKWSNLKNNMLSTNEDIENYTTDMTDFVKSYGDFINEKQTDVLNELSTISERANAVSEQLRNPEGAGTAVMQGDATDGTMVISMQDTLGNDILQLSNMLGSLSETQSGVIEYTGNIQESVNDVQKKADTLNSNWGQNVATTKLIRGDVYGILGNAFGGNDGYVYDHLASPVKISGDVPESKAQNVPPVVILVIVMLSSLLIGYFSHHYQNAPLLVRGALFGILNIIVGLMISLFGLNIYSLADDQAVMWSVFTILLLVASSAIIRTAFMLGSIAGGIATAAMVLFYVAPLLDLAMPNFSFNNPVSTVYMSIQYGTGSQFALGIGALILITIIAIAVPFIIDFAKSRTEESETDHDA